MIFLKCKIRFIYVGFNCKRKKWGKKMSGNFAIKGGGVGRLMANAILNCHFDYLITSLSTCIFTIFVFVVGPAVFAGGPVVFVGGGYIRDLCREQQV